MTCERWRELKKPPHEREFSPGWMLAIEDAVIVYWKPALAVLYVVLSFYFAFTRPSVSWEDEVAQRVMDGHGDVDEVLLEYCDEHPRHEMCR